MPQVKHAFFNPTWYVCNYDGENITLIDSTSENMGENVVWLSANEVAYIKDATLWRAVIR